LVIWIGISDLSGWLRPDAYLALDSHVVLGFGYITLDSLAVEELSITIFCILARYQSRTFATHRSPKLRMTKVFLMI